MFEKGWCESLFSILLMGFYGMIFFFKGLILFNVGIRVMDDLI